jgi:hypothetical protein
VLVWPELDGFDIRNVNEPFAVAQPLCEGAVAKGLTQNLADLFWVPARNDNAE